jgi:hypothetical protein
MNEDGCNTDTSKKSKSENDQRKMTKKKGQSDTNVLKDTIAAKIQSKSASKPKSEDHEWKNSGKLSKNMLDSLYREASYMLSYASNSAPPKLRIKKQKKKPTKTKRSKSFHTDSSSQTASQSTHQDPPVEEKIQSQQTVDNSLIIRKNSTKTQSSTTKTSLSSECKQKIKPSNYSRRFFSDERQGLYENRRTYHSMENVIGPTHKEM